MKTKIQPVGETTLVRAIAQYPGTHHGAQGQRYHARYHHGASQGEGEFAEQGAGQSADEADGRIDRRQCQRHGDDRHGDLSGPGYCGLPGRRTVFDMPVYVFHHHDGVVDHQSDGDHHGQQGQQVEGEAHSENQEHHADKRQRYSDQRNQHHAQGAQEQVDHQDNDKGGFDQGGYDFPQGLLDYHAAIPVQEEFHIHGQVRPDARQRLVHLRGDVQEIGVRCRCDRHEHRVATAGECF